MTDDSAKTAVDAVQFVEAMRCFPAAVNIVTACENHQRVGFTATAVMSLTADPPQIAVAVNRSVSSLPTLLAAGSFCVSTLATHHSEMATRFAGSVKGEARFERGEWLKLLTGAPALSDAVLNLDCRLVQTVEFSTHHLIVGAVNAIRTNKDRKPLLYIDGGWACLVSGADYGVRYMDAVRRTVDLIDSSEQLHPRERLRQLVQELTLFYIEQQQLTREHLNTEAYVSTQQMNDINKLKKEFDQQLTKLLTSGVSKGEFEIDDVRVTAFAISGVVAWVHRWYRADGPLSPGEIGEITSKLVDRMISAKAN